MCGRYTRKAAAEQIYEHFGIDPDEEFADIRIEPSFDIAPGSMQPVVRLTDAGEREIVLMRWGFKMPIQGKTKLVFNTKAETVMDSPLWRSRFMQNRCLVPASSFFEWPKKIKTEIGVRGHGVIGFASLWGTWKNPSTNQVEPTFSIFTTEPNSVMQPIHNRQPAILDPREYEEWFTRSERPPAHLLRIFPEDRMTIAPAAANIPTLFD